MKRVRFDECDSTGEVVNLFNKVFEDLELLNAKVTQLDTKIALLEKKEMKKNKRDDGFASIWMIFIIGIMSILSIIAFADDEINYDRVSNPESLTVLLQKKFGVTGNSYSFANGLTLSNATNNVMTISENSEDLVWTFGTDSIVITSTTGVVLCNFGAIVPAANQFLVNPAVDPVGTTEGTVYYDSDDDNLYVRTSAGWTDLTAGAAGVSDLDTAYNGGSTIDVDTDAVTLTVSDTDNNRVLDLVQNDTTNNPEALRITNTGTGDTLQFASTGTKDIDGTSSTWYITKAGAGVFSTLLSPSMNMSGGTFIALPSGDKIGNTSASEIYFSLASDGEDLVLDLDAGVNAVGLKSNTSVDQLMMGTVDDLTGVGNISFDAASSLVLLTSTGDAQDLTISVAGANNSSLVLNSAGTAADALTIATSAGGIDITVAGAAATEDLDITSNTSVNITGAEAAADAVVISASTAAGGIDITSNADIDITTTGASGEDISLINTGGSVVITATEAATDSVVISSSTAGGGIDITSQEDIDITTTGAAGEDITLTNTGGSVNITATEAATDAIVINASTALGGIDITSNEDIDITTTGAAGEDITITNTGGSVNVTTTEDDIDSVKINSGGGINLDAVNDVDIALTSGAGGEDILITQSGANDSSIILTAAGTGADAIQLSATAGTIDIQGDVMNVDATADLNITVTSSGAGEDLLINQSGANDSSITLTAAGTGADAIGILAAAGGIQMTSLTPILATTNGKTKRYQVFPTSYVSATECRLGGGTGALGAGLAGVDELGATTGYVSLAEAADFLRFWIPLPSTWVDTGTQADLNIQFYIAEQATGQPCNIDVRIFEFNNTTPILTDTIEIADSAAAGWVSLVTNATGIGNDADIDGDDKLYVEITANTDDDNFDIYGVRWVYRVGVQATQ